MRIRPFRPEDGPAMAELHRRAIAAVPDAVTDPEGRASWAAGIEAAGYARSAAAGERFLVAEIGGTVAGFCGRTLSGRTGEIAGLYVAPERWRQGVGRALARAAEAALRAKGATACVVRSSLAGAPAYAALGYRVTGEATHRTRGGLVLPVVTMERRLTAEDGPSAAAGTASPEGRPPHEGGREGACQGAGAAEEPSPPEACSARDPALHPTEPAIAPSAGAVEPADPPAGVQDIPRGSSTVLAPSEDRGPSARAGPAGEGGAPHSPTGAPWRNRYGRRQGKALRASQRGYLADLADLSPGPVSWEDNPERRPLDLHAVFGERPIWLEIGFGGGEHMVHQAALHPEVGLLGAEPYVKGVATLLGQLRREGASNVRVHPGDARDLLDVLPEGSVARVFLLYPDPWPKARHHRRRFVTPEHLEPLARVMPPGAELRLATDISDYVRQALEEVPRAGFGWTARHPRDWREPWPDWSPTRYERKALREGRVRHYLTFRRV